MKKVILTTVLAAGLTATSAFAYKGNCQNGEGMMNKGGKKCQMQKECGMKGKKGSHKGMRSGKGKGGMMMFSRLDLTQDQRYKLSILKDEMRLEMKKQRGPQQRDNFKKFITVDGFDKEGFLKEMKERQAKMMDLKAAHMEKAFAILTKEQIAKLKATK